MRKILTIAWNDIRIDLSDRTTFVFLLALPLVFTTIIGLALGGNANPNADNRAPVLVADEDRSALSGQLLDVLAASDVIRPVAGIR